MILGFDLDRGLGFRVFLLWIGFDDLQRLAVEQLERVVPMKSIEALRQRAFVPHARHCEVAAGAECGVSGRWGALAGRRGNHANESEGQDSDRDNAMDHDWRKGVKGDLIP